ncbi:MAG TPA: hypothetical protein VGJ91_24755, partial [Polyangiaceae bacterium]
MLLASGVWRQTLIGLCLGLCAGCSSATDAPAPAGPSAGPDTQATRERVLTACTEFATRLCADSEACCTQAYARYDQAGCTETLLRDLCRPGADAV